MSTPATARERRQVSAHGLSQDDYEAARAAGATHAEVMEATRTVLALALSYARARRTGATHAEITRQRTAPSWGW